MLLTGFLCEIPLHSILFKMIIFKNDLDLDSKKKKFIHLIYTIETLELSFRIVRIKHEFAQTFKID